jgi:hypothetical protein
MTASLLPVVFDAPLVNPSPTGLFAGVQWYDDESPLRWLGSGVEVRVFNYGGENSYGVWQADPFSLGSDLTVDDVKEPGGWPESPNVFSPLTSWAADACDLTAGSRAEVEVRAQQVLRMEEQTAVEQVFSSRLLTDAGAPLGVADIVDAVGALEGRISETNTLGMIHASAHLAAVAANAQLIRYSGTKMLTPLGHQWVFGGGYVSGLGDTLVASSPVFGWRGQVSVRTAIKQEENLFYAVAERSLALGYEAVFGAVDLAGSQ